MRPSARLLSAGFMRRSLEEAKRLTHIVTSGEGVTGAKTPYRLIKFDHRESIGDCKIFSDADTGGFSKVALDWAPANTEEPAHAKFHGNISIDLPLDKPQVQRTGYAAWRTADKQATIFGRSFWNIDPYRYLALRIKSDGRKYFVNVQTDSIVPTDIHQYPLVTRTPGKWETVRIQWHDFIRTNHGQIVEPQREMLREKVTSVGFGSIDRIPGPYQVCISEVYATN